MAKKKSEIKQKQKQTINITIGDRVVKRRRGRPRKAAPKSAKGSGLVSGGFVAPIINYPPSYTSPSVLQPLQQPQQFRAPAQVPARVAAAAAPLEYAETLTGAPTTDPTRLKLPISDPAVPIPSAKKLFEEEPEAPFQTIKVRRKKKAPVFDNQPEGNDVNLGDAFEQRVDIPAVFQQPDVDLPFEPITVEPRARKPSGRPPKVPGETPEERKARKAEEAKQQYALAKLQRRAAKEAEREAQRLKEQEGELSQQKLFSKFGGDPQGEYFAPAEEYAKYAAAQGSPRFTFLGDPAEEPPPLSELERNRP
jgi:hypothetical protein